MSSKARQLADLGNQVDDGAVTGSNMVVNGAMTVAQRGVSATGKNQNGYYACDRAQVYFSAIDQMVTTVSQDTDAPDGFDKSHKVLVTTAETSVESNELHCMLWYQIEGQDLQQLGYGNANAKPMTVSFWVKSNVTGTYTLSFYGPIGGTTSVLAPTYTINAANTWEYKTITISGSTVGALVNNNSAGLQLYWNGLVGSQYTSGTQATSWSNYATSNWAVGHTADFGLDVNDYWQITGVCLNVGDSAIDFPHESYGDTLAKCQRYYEVFHAGSQTGYLAIGNWWTSNQARCVLQYTEKRTNPSISASDVICYQSGSGVEYSLSETIDDAHSTHALLYGGVSGASTTQGHSLQMRVNANGSIQIDAEL